MTRQSMDYLDILLDFEALSPEAITLDALQIDRALQLSSQMHSERQQWQTYLNALAMFAFGQWLSERAPDIAVDWEQSLVCQPHYARVIEAACNLKVGKFKVCLVAIGTATDEVVALPRAVIDLPEFTAHFYVVVEIIEELEQATIHSFLRYDQLLKRQRSVNLIPEPDWTYNLPLAWFETNVDDLLLYLRCLEPHAIPLPKTSSLPVSNSRREAVEVLLSQTDSLDGELWQVLTWEQGAIMLTTPDLLYSLYNNQKYSYPASDRLQRQRELMMSELEISEYSPVDTLLLPKLELKHLLPPSP